jgi:proteasome lid subunit RPN8/RPN11
MMAIRIDDAVMAEIEEHCFSDVSREVGGVLHGVVEDREIVIRGALPALKAQGDQISVTFTHEVWDDVHARLDRDHPDQRILGWYHTHPGFGLFLSEYDRFIHQNFFSDPAMVALVVDPIAGELGWFGWDGGEVIKASTSPTAAAAVGSVTQGVTSAVQGSRSWRRATPALLLLGTALGLGGFLLGAQVNESEPEIRQSAAATQNEELLEKARQEVAALRAELNEAKESARPDTSGKGTFDYVIRRGDTLSEIAFFLYGDARAFHRITDANPGLEPDRLVIGNRIKLPLPEERP